MAKQTAAADSRTDTAASGESKPERIGIADMAEAVRRSQDRWTKPLPPEVEERIRAEHERSQAENRQRRLAAAVEPLVTSIGRDYSDASLNSFQVYHAGQRAVLAELREFQANIAAHAERGEGLVLYGRCGTGKDHLAAAVMLHAARDHFLGCEWLNVRDLCGMGFDAADATIARLTNHELQVVTLSDPGYLNEVGADRLYRIADGRNRNRLSTCLTVNANSPDEIDDLIGPATWGRIAQRAAIVRHCQWPDYRMRGLATSERTARV